MILHVKWIENSISHIVGTFDISRPMVSRFLNDHGRRYLARIVYSNRQAVLAQITSHSLYVLPDAYPAVQRSLASLRDEKERPPLQ